MSSAIIDALNKVKVRYPGEPAAVLLADLIREKRLTDFLKMQYPDVEEPGHVQFIPEVRGYTTIDQNPGLHFPKQEMQEQAILYKYGTYIAGFEHEINVQDCFGSLRESELLKGRSLIVIHNLKHETIYHSKLKKAWTNEFDIVVLDINYGVFICEIKQRAYQSLKDSTNKKYSLELELDKQEKRHHLLSQVREFYGNDKIPIHTVLLCNSQQDESLLIEDGTDKINDQDYRFVVNLNIKEGISSIWSEILGHLPRVASPISDNIMEFTALLYAIQTIDKLMPSDIHTKFLDLQFQKRKNIIKREKRGERREERTWLQWTREQNHILDHVIYSFKYHAGLGVNPDPGNLRLSIKGCMGSGKTLLLMKIACLFTEMFPYSPVLFLVASRQYNLLLKRLPQMLKRLPRSCMYNINKDTIIFAPCYPDYMNHNSSSKKDTFLKQATQYKLILIDEYHFPADWTLDLSNVNDSHIALATSLSGTTVNLTDLKKFELSGSLRNTKEITEAVLKGQENECAALQTVPASSANKLSYRNVKHFSFEELEVERCINECIDNIKKLLDEDRNQSILLISAVHRSFLYLISERLNFDDIPHQFTTDSLIARPCYTNDGGTITLCDPREATGCEASTVIHVHDAYNAQFEALALSRATAQAFVYTIDGIYNEVVHLSERLSTPITDQIKMSCYENIGQKDCKSFIQYLKDLVQVIQGIQVNNNQIEQKKQKKQYPEDNKILVAYSLELRSMIKRIEESLPAEVQNRVAFNCHEHGCLDFYSLDNTNHFILLLECYSTDYLYLAMTTMLPVKTIKLIADQEGPSTVATGRTKCQPASAKKTCAIS